MKPSIIFVVCFLSWFSVLSRQVVALDVPDLPEATKPIPGALVVPEGTGVHIFTHHGEWSSFFNTGGGGEPFFLISGALKNTSGKSLAYIKLQFELLSEDGVVIMRDYGYNRKAEALREEEYEAGKKSLVEMAIEQLKPGEQDGFRFFFFKEDLPEFHSYRVRLLETR